MRDMLIRLKTISEEEDNNMLEYDVDNKPKHDVDNWSLSQEAIVFENTSDMDEILQKANSIHKEIFLLQLEIERLSTNNERFTTCVGRFTLLKRDSDAIARKIKQQGVTVYDHIQDLGQKCKEMEKKDGANSAVCRIARAQYDTLTRAFQAAMSDYNKAEELQRTKCRMRIQRQASILGKNISDEKLDELVGKGGEGWTELSHDIHLQTLGSCRSALCEIKGRHKELVELEVRLKEVHELFLDMAALVEEQGSLLNSIEFNVLRTSEYIASSNSEIKKAIRRKKRNPFLQCCPCLPCWGQ